MGRGVVEKRTGNWGVGCGEEGVMKGKRRRVGEGRLKVWGRFGGEMGGGRCGEEGGRRKM